MKKICRFKRKDLFKQALIRSLQFPVRLVIPGTMFFDIWVTVHFWVIAGTYYWVVKICAFMYFGTVWVAKLFLNIFCGSPTTKS